MKKRILLTGATGFVGRQILSALFKAGVDLRLVLREGYESRLPQNKGLEIVRSADLFKESTDWWTAACQGVNIVIHTAWYAEPGVYMQSPKNLDCLAGTLRLAAGCSQAGVQRVVGIGSCSEYDMTTGHLLSVDTPLRPTTPYAGAKAATFLALSSLLPQQDIGFAWARLFYLYGEGEDTRRLVPYLHARLSAGEPVELTSGTQIRDYLNVTTAGSQIAALALGSETGAFNICSGQAQTVRELAEQIADEYGRRDLLRFGARADNKFDPPCVVGIRSKVC
jgi:dTDP-6-deoxy-L-talose 4-dehydrogenase (NAD+)